MALAKVITVLFLVALACPACYSQDFVISDVAIVDIEQSVVVEHRDVYISGERIVDITEAQTSRQLQEIGAAGLFLIPGLWDFHAHLTMEEESGYAERSLSAFVPNGVLTVVDMGGELDRLNAWRAEIDNGERVGPTILAAGPFIDGEKDLDGSEALSRWRRRSMRVIDSPSQIPALVDQLAPEVDLLKAHSRLPREAFLALAAEAVTRGKALAVHLPVGVSALDAAQAGARTIEHSISFLGDSIYEDDPETMVTAISAAIEDLKGDNGERLFAALASSKVCVTPTLASTVRVARGIGTPFFDQVASDLEWITLQLYRSGVTLLAGSDANSERDGKNVAEDLLLELEHLMSIGIPANAVLRSATVNPAVCLERNGDGRVMPGARANLVLLEENPLLDIANVRTVRGVFANGDYVDLSESEPR